MSETDTTKPAADAAPPADLSGRVLGDFQVLRRLGVGGMGQVYLARQTSLKRDVALKLLRGELTTNATALARFQAEAEAVARLTHANIVQVYAIGEADGLRYMALEYVEGRNLREYLARKGPPELPVCLSLIRQVAAALQRAHEQGIVHRDIKPENILVTKRAEAKVTDFGLSRLFAGPTPALNLTQSGVTLGTPLYMAPEQVQGTPVDHRTDIYSFGVTCYHLLTGEPPFRGNTAFDVAMKHVHEQPKPVSDLRPDLPADLCGMVHKMMAKEPADRYQSAREILRDVAKVREGLALGLTQAVTGGLPAAGLNGAGNPSGAVLSLSGVGSASGGGASTLGLTPAAGMPLPARWPWALAAGLFGLLAAAAGVGLNAALHPPDPAPPPFAGPGLPDVRPADRLAATTRERELIDLLNRRETTPDKVIAHTVELGLLYARERRPDDAEARFKRLDSERFTGIQKTHAQVVGAFGRAVVLSQRDQAGESNKLFEEAIRLAGQRPTGKPAAKSAFAERAARQALLNHPDLAQAVAEALNRNAANLGVAKLKPELEPFRTARGITGPG